MRRVMTREFGDASASDAARSPLDRLSLVAERFDQLRAKSTSARCRKTSRNPRTEASRGFLFRLSPVSASRALLLAARDNSAPENSRSRERKLEEKPATVD